MALHESNRENLLAEATAYVERFAVERRIGPDEFVELFAGRRSNSAMSIYDGPDRVFQFDELGKWRRGFYFGNRIGLADGRPVELLRLSRGGRVQLQTLPLSKNLLEEYVAAWDTLKNWIAQLSSQISHQNMSIQSATTQPTWRWIGSVPPGDSIPSWFYPNAFQLDITPLTT